MLPCMQQSMLDVLPDGHQDRLHVIIAAVVLHRLGSDVADLEPRLLNSHRLGLKKLPRSKREHAHNGHDVSPVDQNPHCLRVGGR